MAWRCQCFSVWFIHAFLFGTARAETYDAIIVGAGGGGCPLAQTLIEGGKKVLLLERGGEPPSTAGNIVDFGNALLSECVETFSSFGVQVSTGNCLGGATTFNQGIWIEETPEWIKTEVEERLGRSFFSLDKIRESYEWVREQVAPLPTQDEPGSNEEAYVSGLFQSFKDTLGVDGNLDGTPTLVEEGIWRPHSIFEPSSGFRRSADQVLDRENPNLTLRLNTEVEKVIFEGSGFWDFLFTWFFSWWWPFGGFGTDDLRAKCVRVKGGSDECVDPGDGGKIFLTAGAFQTPGLLLASGIGPTGTKKVNFHVGKHLSDKPMLPIFGFFKNDFDYSNQLTINHISANKEFDVGFGKKRTFLFEEISFGLGEIFFPFFAYERAYIPFPIRDLFIVDEYVDLILRCKDGAQTQECDPVLPFIEGNCDKESRFFLGFLADPSSEGIVWRDLFGGLNVNVNYLGDITDLIAFKKLTSTTLDIIDGVQGPSAWQPPCDDNKLSPDQECKATNCPDLLAGMVTDLAFDFPLWQFLVDFVNFPTEIFEGVVSFGLGVLSANPSSLISPHHFGGSARFGDVIKRDFSVIGTTNLYVADASALPKTPRANAMASSMMMGRLAGTTILEDW